MIVELSLEVLEAVRKHTATSARRVFTAPRVKIVIGDGRRYVQSALKHGERFDLIPIKINEPWHAGSGNLFTVEFLGLVKNLLADGGYLGVRPLLGHLSDGLQVFGSAVYLGYYHLFFKNGKLPRFKQAVITPDIASLWRRNLPGVETYDSPRQCILNVAQFFAGDPKLQVDVSSDDRPTFGYYWLRQRLGMWVSPRENLGSPRFNDYRRTVPVMSRLEP